MTASVNIDGGLLLRADADEQMGTGHLMRCLALAQAWQAGGGRTTFVSRCDSGALRRRVEEAGASLVPLAEAHPDPGDLPATVAALGALRGDSLEGGNGWVVVDGYHFDPAYHRALREAGGRLTVIDDFGHLSYYDADAVVNQNAHAQSIKYRCAAETQLLLGTRYAMLRPEFTKRRGSTREIADVGRRVLVTMGGSDPHNVTLKAIEALRRADIEGLEAVVVVGASNPHFAGLQDAACNSGVPLRLVRDASNMPELMAWADLAVSGAGSTLWELAFMRVPSVVMVLAENQRMAGEAVNQDGTAVSLGWFEDVAAGDIARTLTALSRDLRRRKEMCERGGRLVDGMGSSRVVGAMLSRRQPTMTAG